MELINCTTSNLNLIVTPDSDYFNNFNAQDRFRSMELNDEKPAPLVLLYSNSNEIISLIEAFLRLWNYRTKVASSEKQLLEILDGEFPAIILFDLSFELISDLKLLHQIRASAAFQNTPVLVLSGHARYTDASLAFAAGANEYFIKPINFDYLHNRLNQYSLQEINRPHLGGNA